MRVYYNGVYRDATQEELEQFAQNAAEAKTRPLTQDETNQMIIGLFLNQSEDISDETALRMTAFFPEWCSDVSYDSGCRVKFHDILYRCLQTHSSQDAWNPAEAPSLWSKVLIQDENVIPEWEQPDSTNPYMAGDKVKHNGKHWESTVDNNVWEPGVYGWVEFE